MYCPHCGKEIEDNSRFCGNCGYKLPRRWEVHISANPKLKEEMKQSFQDPVHAEITSVPFSIAILVLAFFVNLLLSCRILPAMMHMAGNDLFGGLASGWFRASGSTHVMNAAGSTIAVYLVVFAAVLLAAALKKEEFRFSRLFCETASVLFIPVILVFAGVLLSSVFWLSSCIFLAALFLVLMNLEGRMPENLSGWWKTLLLVIASAVLLLVFFHVVSMVVKEAAGTSLRYFLREWGY